MVGGENAQPAEQQNRRQKRQGQREPGNLPFAFRSGWRGLIWLVAHGNIVSFRFAIGKAGVVAAERVQLSVRADDVRAAAVNAVLVPRRRVHERLDEQPERVRFVQLELLEQLAQRFGFAAAFHQVFQLVADLGAEKSLHVFEVNEIADGPDLPADLEQIADGGAIRVAARQRREIVEPQLAGRLPDGGEDDVGGVEVG